MNHVVGEANRMGDGMRYHSHLPHRFRPRLVIRMRVREGSVSIVANGPCSGAR